VTELRGQVVEQLAVAVVPTYHPAAVLRAAERKDQMRDDLVRDLHVAAELLVG
jgi:uracil-DNA glycosylase